MSIREKIIEFLKNNNRKSIKEIAKAIQENEASVRTKIFDKEYGLLTKGTVVRVSHEKRTGYFSLAKNYAKDDSILKKMIPKFIEHKIKVDLEDNEINRIKELWGDINRD